MKIYFTHGRPMPLPEAVINTDTLEPEENPRKKNQYEPKPNFSLVDFRTGILWLNNTKKKNTLLQFLKEELDEKNIIIKDAFNEADFDVIIYPNPFSSEINIKGLNDKSYYIIYDLMGKQILLDKIKSEKNIVNLSVLSSGMYLLKVINENGNYKTYKITKSN